jgi:hypothetical protein
MIYSRCNRAVTAVTCALAASVMPTGKQLSTRREGKA